MYEMVVYSRYTQPNYRVNMSVVSRNNADIHKFRILAAYGFELRLKCGICRSWNINLGEFGGVMKLGLISCCQTVLNNAILHECTSNSTSPPGVPITCQLLDKSLYLLLKHRHFTFISPPSICMVVNVQAFYTSNHHATLFLLIQHPVISHL